MRIGNTVFASVFAAALSAPVTQAQRPDAGNYSPARHQVVETRSVMVTMRDAVRVSVDLYRPDAPGPQAGILFIYALRQHRH